MSLIDALVDQSPRGARTRRRTRSTPDDDLLDVVAAETRVRQASSVSPSG
jgi:hypothetical protein